MTPCKPSNVRLVLRPGDAGCPVVGNLLAIWMAERVDTGGH